MTNVEKLNKIGILGIIRMRLGAENPKEELYNDQINGMDRETILSEYSAWYLGSRSWWVEMKDIYDKL